MSSLVGMTVMYVLATVYIVLAVYSLVKRGSRGPRETILTVWMLSLFACTFVVLAGFVVDGRVLLAYLSDWPLNVTVALVGAWAATVIALLSWPASRVNRPVLASRSA